MKPVVLVGKGPSAQAVPASTDYVVAAVNNATMFCETVDYLFIQDIEILEAMSQADYQKSSMAVVPTHPYRNHNQYANLTYLDMLKQMQGVSQFSIYQPRFENPELVPVDDIEHFSDIYSGGDAAVAWLLARGFRDFHLVGIDPAGGYHQQVTEAAKPLEAKKDIEIQCPHCQNHIQATVTMGHHAHHPKQERWFQLQYGSLTRKIQMAGGTFSHVAPGAFTMGAVASS